MRNWIPVNAVQQSNLNKTLNTKNMTTLHLEKSIGRSLGTSNSMKIIIRRLLVTAVAFALALIPVCARAFLPGDLYVSDSNSGTVFYFTPAGTKVVFGSAFSAPQGLAFHDDDLFVAESGAGRVLRISLHTGISTVASGLGTPYGLAFDGKGNLFVADNFTGTIFKLSGPAGSLSDKTIFASGLNSPSGLAFDSKGNLFVANPGTNSILKFTPAGVKTTFASGLNDPNDLAFDSSGNLYETDAGGDKIFKFTPAGAKTTFATNLFGPFGLAFDATGNLFEVSFGYNTIFKFTPAGGRSTFASGLNSPTFAAFRPKTDKLINISTRGLVGTGDHVLIAGFIVGGNALVNNLVGIRAIGPSLSSYGITDALQNPTLELHNASGALIASNNDWRDTQQAQIQAAGLAPADQRESVIIIALPSGNYTAIVRGLASTTGVALAEVYNLR